MGYIFGGNTGISYEQLRQQRKALEARKSQSYAPKDIGSGLSALGHALGTRLAAGRLARAETARQGRADNVFSAFQTILGGNADSPTSQPMSSPATQDADGVTFNGDIKSGIMATAQSLGVDPVDLATAISYETGGSFSPTQPGPTTQWGQHRGLIQFGEPQAKKYGVDWNDPIGSQLGPNGAVAKYLRDTGVKPGMGLLDIYSAINAGGVGLYNRSDANNGGAPGTVRDKVEKQMAGHRAKALAMFKDYQPRQAQPAQLASLDPNAGAQMAFAPQNEPQQPAQGALQTLLAQRNGGGQPRQQTAQVIQPAKPAPFGGVDPRLIQMMRDPSLSPQTRSTMQFLLQQHLKANAPMDPLKALQIERQQLELERLRNPQADPMDAIKLQQEQLRLEQMQNPERSIIEGADGFKYYQDTGERVLPNVQQTPEPGYQMLSPDQVQQMGLPQGSYQQGPKGRISQIGGGGTNVTVNNGAGETAFAKTTGNELAKSTNEIAAAGDTARQHLNRINRLESLLAKVPHGIDGYWRQMASNVGLGDWANASDIEAAQALISAMVPEQRPQGSGTMSDADLDLFKQSLPRIINTEGGNKKIIETIRGIAQHDIQRGDIARRLQLGEISSKQAFDLYGSLENPLGWLSEETDNAWENLGNGVRLRRVK